MTLWLLTPTSLLANWSLNIGFDNPPGSEIGLNFLYEWSNYGLELGIGKVNSNFNIDSDDNNSTRNNDNDGVGLGLGGDINFKAFFLSTPLRPYIQVGTMLGTYAAVGDDSGFGLGGSSLFVGGGLWVGSTGLYGYLGLSTFGNGTFLQLGIGFDI